MHGIYIFVSSTLSRTVKEYCRKSSISQWRNIAGNHQYHSKGILRKINITVKVYCRKSSISQGNNIAGNNQYHSEGILQEIINIITVHTIQSVTSPVARWVFSSFWGSFVGVNSSNLRAILFIHLWNVLQAAGSTSANIHLWHKVYEIQNHIKNSALQVMGMWRNIFWQISNILNILAPSSEIKNIYLPDYTASCPRRQTSTPTAVTSNFKE